MIKLKLNLAGLAVHAIKSIKNKKGELIDCVIIPIKDNHIFKSEKGNLFIDAIALEKKNPFGTETHTIMQSFSKDEREKRKAAGIKNVYLGDLTADQPQGEGFAQPTNDFGGTDTPVDAPAETLDDLPF